MGWLGRLLGRKQDPRRRAAGAAGDETQETGIPLWQQMQMQNQAAAVGTGEGSAGDSASGAPGMAEQRVAEDAAQPLQEAQDVAPADQGMAEQAPAADAPSVDSGSWDSSSFDPGSSDSGASDSGSSDSGGNSGSD